LAYLAVLAVQFLSVSCLSCFRGHPHPSAPLGVLGDLGGSNPVSGRDVELPVVGDECPEVLLGRDFLRHFVARLDGPRQELTLESGAGSPS
jgi:hypothetical protein